MPAGVFMVEDARYFFVRPNAVYIKILRTQNRGAKTRVHQNDAKLVVVLATRALLCLFI